MKYKISFEKRALNELRKLEVFVAKRIIKKIKEPGEDPFSRDIRRLKHQTFFRLRVGDYRALFEILGREIKILKVGHRRNIYDL